MINNFFNIVGQDIAFLADYAEQPHPNQAQQDKVKLVAMRLFAALGIAVSIVQGIRSFAAKTAVGTIFKLATAVALYTFSHDVFVIGVNSEKDVLDQLGAAGRGLWNDAKDFWCGKKTVDDALRHPWSEGTFYRPLWDSLFAQE